MNGPKKSDLLEKYGHAGGHLRDALTEALEFGDAWFEHVEIDFNERRHNVWWSRLSARSRARWLIGQLWRCSDIVPWEIRAQFEEDGQDVLTYSRLARLLAKDLKPIKEAG
jgi:hypothetical protein